MSNDQVRWKINSLIKKYKECIDNNAKSGRSPLTFKWFDQLDDIFHQQKDASTSGYIMSSKLQSTSTEKTQSHSSTVDNDSNISSAIHVSENSQNSNSIDVTPKSRKRTLHGSGSNLAKTKITLEKQ